MTSFVCFTSTLLYAAQAFCLEQDVRRPAIKITIAKVDSILLIELFISLRKDEGTIFKRINRDNVSELQVSEC